MNFWGPKIAEDAINNFLSALSSYPKNPTKKNYEKFINRIISVFYLPQPSKIYLSYASKELSALTIAGLISQLRSSSYVTNSMIQKIFKACDSLDITPHTYGGNRWYRLRTFEENGMYPDRNFIKHEASYLVDRGQPYILTLNYRGAENQASGEGNENFVLTRKEVKLLSSLMCSQYWGTRFSLVDNIESTRTIDVNFELLKNVSPQDLLNVLLDYSIISGNKYMAGAGSFEFLSSEIAYIEADKYFRNYSLQDSLLLRTSYLHIKASSMYGVMNYYEDSVSNIFIALEGALVMLQRNDGKAYSRIDRSFHKDKFNVIFNQGPSIYDFVMDEVFDFGEKRASLVHPQAGTVWGWVPYLNHEDYRDYRDILKQLVFYSVTGCRLADPY